MEASSILQNIYPNIPKAPIEILTIAGRANIPEPITTFTMESVSPGTPTTRFKPSSALAVDMVIKVFLIMIDLWAGSPKQKEAIPPPPIKIYNTIIKIIISKYAFGEQNFL